MRAIPVILTFCIVTTITLTVLYAYNATHAKTKKTKIVGLVPARNDAVLLGQCLKALTQYTDAIVYLDDASDDASLSVVELLAEECNIETIIRKRVWNRNEPEDRNTLLAAGRAIGGTHFIVLDADEMFTATCLKNNILRTQILSLKLGDRLKMHWIKLWKSLDWYRIDDAVYKDFIFCDDCNCFYRSGFIHTQRTPKNLKGSTYTIKDHREYGVIHFHAAHWRNYLIKQAWYRCFEHIRWTEKTTTDINKTYANTKDETTLKCWPCRDEWFAYSFYNPTVINHSEEWREQQILSWFDKYGGSYFKDLDIWDVDWGGTAKATVARPVT